MLTLCKAVPGPPRWLNQAVEPSGLPGGTGTDGLEAGGSAVLNGST
jgi:hypothetical protein